MVLEGSFFETFNLTMKVMKGNLAREIKGEGGKIENLDAGFRLSIG